MKTLAALSIALFMTAATAYASSPAQTYNKANELYLKGDYEKALELYNSINVTNPDLEYNRAAAYYKTGRIGEAVTHFGRALRLRPSDDDTRANIDYLREVKTDREKTSSPGALMSASRWVVYAAPLDAMEYVMVILYLSMAGLVLAMILTQNAQSRVRLARALVAAGAVFVLWGGMTAFRVSQFERTDQAVAIAMEIEAHAAPSKESDTVFTFHEGTQVTISRVEGDFALVTLSSGISGWAPRAGLERI